MSLLRSVPIATLVVAAFASCASPTRSLGAAELEGVWRVGTVSYREDLGCIIRGSLTVAGVQSDGSQLCAIDVRETCEVYDADKFVVARDTCTVTADGSRIIVQVDTRKVLAGASNYLKPAPHKLARYELGMSTDGRTLSGRYFGDWEASVRLQRQ
jgi:hypothetical protein